MKTLIKNPIKKGNWYYELQILMFVFMWKHDKNYKPAKRSRGVRVGNFFVWYDTAWTRHGFANKIYMFWHELTINTNKFRRLRGKWVVLKANIRRLRNKKDIKNAWNPTFIRSLIAFLKLSKQGFRITHSSSQVTSLEIFRFFWKKEILSDFPDIDRVDGKFSTMQNGQSKKLK